jgi:pyruvate kinase
MINNIKHAREDLDKDCKVYMDLAGVKIRTGLLAKGARGDLTIRLYQGDCFELHCDAVCSVPEQINATNNERTPAVIACTSDVFMSDIKKGDPVWFDDGKLGSVVEQVTDRSLKLKVTHAGPKGVKIKADKGINFPDTLIDVPTLTDEDISQLDFVCEHADIIGVSFVQTASDLDQVFEQLQLRQVSPPIIAKIETKSGVENLPDILLKGLNYQGLFGIMIARGDLAVELGSVRMAEIQEQILWLCEAAHTPVIWATQVLETLAKKGVVSRPEITDAAMSVRAECVMLNKGDYILNAVKLLDQILEKMQAHQYKQIIHLRALNW